MQPHDKYTFKFHRISEATNRQHKFWQFNTEATQATPPYKGC